MSRRRVLILCTGNSARSQMAEGLVRHFHGDRFEAASAGTQPSRVRPEAIAVMRELGIDIAGQRSKHVDELQGERFDWVLTVCDSARESCPFFPGARSVHHDVADPAEAGGDEAARLAEFRRARDELRSFVDSWLEAPKDVIRRLFQEVDAGREDFVDEFYSPDYVDHTPSRSRAVAPGREGVRQAFAAFRRAFPDARHVLEDLVAEGDRVTVRLTASGTHTGELFGLQPTGRLVSQSGIVIYRLRDGRIVERWAQASSELLEELER